MATAPSAAANANTFPSALGNAATSPPPKAHRIAGGQVLRKILDTLTNWRNDPNLKDRFDKYSG